MLVVVEHVLCPSCVRWMQRGQVPLHVACERGASAVVVNALLAAYPEAVRCRDSAGCLPLHAAAANPECSKDVVALLVDRHPDSVLERDEESRLPLHHACVRGDGATPDVVAQLVMLYPDTALAVDSSGSVALHIACTVDAPNERLLRLLLSVDESAASVVDERGRFPLHLLSRASASVSTAVLVEGAIESQILRVIPVVVVVVVVVVTVPVIWLCDGLAVMTAYSGAASIPDDASMLPLHHLLDAGRCRHESFLAILEAYPEAAASVRRSC